MSPVEPSRAGAHLDANTHRNGSEPADGQPVPGESLSPPASALLESRVDLLALIRDGIPERDFIPGMGGALARGKRHHIAGEAKVGKTITVAIIGAIDIITEGGVATILDRENGALSTPDGSRWSSTPAALTTRSASSSTTTTTITSGPR